MAGVLARLREHAGGRKRAVPPIRVVVIEVEHEGRVHRVAVKRTANARRFSLRVRTARRDVVLTMPAQSSLAAARAFAARHAAWVAERVEALDPVIPLTVGSELPFRGHPHRIVHRAGLRRAVWTEETPDGPILCVSGPPARTTTAVMAYLRSMARQDLSAAVARHAATAGVTVGRLTLRDTRSRWGSCTSRGDLSFSWRLILAPPHVLDYLAAHEVAHRVHLNHSDAFWDVVRRLFPALKEAENWLKRNGAALHRYGAAAIEVEPASAEPSRRKPR